MSGSKHVGQLFVIVFSTLYKKNLTQSKGCCVTDVTTNSLTQLPRNFLWLKHETYPYVILPKEYHMLDLEKFRVRLGRPKMQSSFHVVKILSTLHVT